MYEDGSVDYLDRIQPARTYACDNIDLAVEIMSGGALNGIYNYSSCGR